jgi:hypothetical protein
MNDLQTIVRHPDRMQVTIFAVSKVTVLGEHTNSAGRK